MVKQTSALQRRKTPVATPDRLNILQGASRNLNAISFCIASIGRDLAGKQNAHGAMDGTSNALNWLATEIDRRCALIDEALS